MKALALGMIIVVGSVVYGQTQAERSQSNAATEATAAPQNSAVFPDLTSTRQPLTVGGKFRLFVTSSVSPARVAGASVGALFGQAIDSPRDYGQGSEGYVKRFGASMATGASKNFLGNFLLPSVLHQDPRFFVKQDAGFNERMKYALRRVVVVQTDGGRNTFNWSGILAPFAAQGIANAYLPERERTVRKTMLRSGIMVGTSAATNVLKACWPVIVKGTRKRQ